MVGGSVWRVTHASWGNERIGVACGVSGEAKGGGGSEAGACLDDAGGSALSELLAHGLQLLSLHLQLRGVVSHLAAVFFTDLQRKGWWRR